MNFHRKCLLIFSTTVISGFLVHLLLFFFNLGVPMEQERYLHEWLVKKDTYAESITKKKIVFVSGSNTLFGVDTEAIEHSLGIPTVNFGTHATMRYYNLKRAKKHLKAGDIVILPLEYPYYTWHHDVFGPEQAFYYLGYAPEEFYLLSFIDQLKFISQLNPKDLLKFTYQRFHPPAKIEGDYSSQYLNLNGDMTNNHTNNRQSNSSLQSKINKKVFSEPPLTDDATLELTSFINYCHDNQIKVYAAWPNYLWMDKVFSDTDLTGIHTIENFYKAHNIEILGNYTDGLYDIEYFYDTNYHLNEEGKRIHTEYLINLLKDKLPHS